MQIICSLNIVHQNFWPLLVTFLRQFYVAITLLEFFAVHFCAASRVVTLKLASQKAMQIHAPHRNANTCGTSKTYVVFFCSGYFCDTFAFCRFCAAKRFLRCFLTFCGIILASQKDNFLVVN